MAVQEISPYGGLCGCGSSCNAVCGSSCEGTVTASGKANGENRGKKFKDPRVRFEDSIIESYGGMHIDKDEKK